ncbi:GerMN domain-containing protein [Dorea longicatena]|uniref:GerMN domain-containing protein n=1 Tax=Dorea longicatena TaxID=88431 RepID=UPI003F886595
MRKRTIVLTALLAGCLVVGCQGKEAKDNTAKDKAKTEIGNEKKEDSKSSDDQEAETEENNAGEESLETKSDEQTSQDTNMEEAQQPVSVTIYSENENADGFDQETIQVDALSAENLIAQLKKKGMLSEDVQVNSFEETEDEGEKALKLDLNQVYLQQLQSMGSAGEYMIMGSVCNTFLDAYGCNKIQVTADGQEIVTGHAEYPGYNGKFE